MQTFRKALRAYPILISAIGVGIHFLGLLKLFQLDTPHLNHIIMLLVDSLVLTGPVVFAALLILVFNKKLFVGRSK